MTNQPNANDERPESSHRESRLDMEVEDILRKSDNVRPFPDPETRKARKPSSPNAGNPNPNNSMPSWARKAMETPLLIGVAFAILSFVIADTSPLLAALFALAAVVFVLLPIVQRYRRPAAAPETKMWRGRVIESRSSPDSVVKSFKRWWRSRRP